jgi:hypothetical protein
VGEFHRTSFSRPCGYEGSGQSALAVQGSDPLCSAMRPARTALAVCWWATRSTASARHLQGNTGRVVPAHPTQCAFDAEIRSLANLPLPPIHQGLSHRLFEIFSYLCSLHKCGNDIAFPPAKPHSSAAPRTKGLSFALDERGTAKVCGVTLARAYRAASLLGACNRSLAPPQLSLDQHTSNRAARKRLPALSTASLQHPRDTIY